MKRIDDNNLKNKYGEQKVLVVENSTLFSKINKKNFVHNFLSIDDYELVSNIINNGLYMLRYKAENNQNYKQAIPYIIFKKNNTEEYFCMKRINGDLRLIGKKSIGVGGHIDNNETIEEGLYREIKEEVNLCKNDILQLDFKGLILDESNDVGKVHIGLLYVAIIPDTLNLQCIEKDKLYGYFASKDMLITYLNNKEFETWSEIAIKELFNIKND